MPSFANNGSLSIMAITKAIIAVIIVGTTAYCLVMQIPIPENMEKIILLIIGGYFGYSATVYRESQKNQEQLYRDVWETFEEVYKDAGE